ncbi:NAD(P)H-dependent flavin oxidoreductase [Pollutimonas harenae]|uniref:Nitronate monooxygenase n=1 Tax=Pollutimonas harenae TaxID=657015 RepID=A0A853GPU7_9BURK|nr:nitronate monooxygenase family protein [Pollutimonas harenae]NYT85058.1 nitronate monooxygenase [Pollutimonas harenae]TEA72558.1 nitronate monooxygenase [Pollutimonas harenae]
MPRTLVNELYQQLSLPVISAPMFIVSGPELVIAQCANGIIGSMPALNARPQSQLAKWLAQINNGLSELKRLEPDRTIAPYAINHIIHKSNDRLQEDLAVCAEYKVPLIITSLRAPNDVVDTVHGWGGKVFHDVTTLRHAQKALEAGVDGLILVCSGAGGHAGMLSPFALLAEVRKIFKGPIALSGAISRGQDVLAARAMGADFAYIGTRFIASDEANAQEDYKQMLVGAQASDIVYTPYFSGIPGNYLKPSITAAGFDPEHLPDQEPNVTNFGNTRSKVWRDIWSAGQGVGSIEQVLPVTQIVDRLKQEYQQAHQALDDNFK